MKIISLLCVTLFASLITAYSGPYAAVADWYYPGCSDSYANNYVYSLYLYPADESCFVPTGGLSLDYGYRISIINNTAVSITQYYDKACSGESLATDYYLIGACPSTSYYQVSIFQTMPSNEYWLDQGYVGSDGPWETILAVDYYRSGCQNSTWVNREIIGWEECEGGHHIYCENNEIHFDSCTDFANCASGCIENYQPLSDVCTANDRINPTSYWSLYLDTQYYSHYQSTCVGTVDPCDSPDDDSSSDEPSKGIWVLLLGITLVVGVSIGLLVGCKLGHKKRQGQKGDSEQPHSESVPKPSTAYQAL